MLQIEMLPEGAIPSSAAAKFSSVASKFTGRNFPFHWVIPKSFERSRTANKKKQAQQIAEPAEVCQIEHFLESAAALESHEPNK